MVFGTPMTDMPSSDMCAAAPSVPSPPIAINPSSARSAKVCRTFFDPTFVVRIRPGAPQDRAAPMQDALHRLLRQLPDPQQRCRRVAARSRDVPPRIAEVEQWATSPSSNGSTRSDDATSGASFDRAAASCSSISAGSPRPARRSSASSATPSGRRRGSRPGPWRRRRATRGPRGGPTFPCTPRRLRAKPSPYATPYRAGIRDSKASPPAGPDPSTITNRCSGSRGTARRSAGRATRRCGPPGPLSDLPPSTAPRCPETAGDVSAFNPSFSTLYLLEPG
jgi:hypothetical protein